MHAVTDIRAAVNGDAKYSYLPDGGSVRHIPFAGLTQIRTIEPRGHRSSLSTK